MANPKNSVSEFFAKAGPLARQLQGFEPRAEQVAVAEAVAEALSSGGRLLAEAGTWVLQARQPDGWLSLYAFTEEPQHPTDFEVANYYVSTHPDSRFTRTLTVQRPGREVRHSLIDRELTADHGDEPQVRSVGEEDLLPVLAETFGLHFPSGTRFAAKTTS